MFTAYLYCISLLHILKAYLYCISLLSCCCLLLVESCVDVWSFWGCLCSIFGRFGWSEGVLEALLGVFGALGLLLGDLGSVSDIAYLCCIFQSISILHTSVVVLLFFIVWVLGRFSVVLGVSWVDFWSLWVVWRVSWELFWRSWGLLGRSWATLGRSWSV